MERNKIISVLCLLGTVISTTADYCPVMASNVETCYLANEDNDLHLNIKKLISQPNNDIREPRTPVMIPEVTMSGHTLHFITPCTGLTLQLVQDDEVCYETVITSDYLEIPSSIRGVYELQILRGNYVFFAEIEL